VWAPSWRSGTEAYVAGVDLTVIGITLVGTGAIGLMLTLLVWDPRPQVAGIQRSDAHPPVAPRRGLVKQRPTVDEHRAYEHPPP
jgi:hypothetical protein